MTDSSPLLEDLKQAAEKPAPKDFRPGVVYSGRQIDTITTDAIEAATTEQEWEAAVRSMGIHIPDGYGLQLVEAVLAGSTNPAAWHRDPEDKGANHTAYTAPNTTQRWRYRFKLVLKDPRADEDIAVLAAQAKRNGRGRPLRVKGGGTQIIELADFQLGKVDLLGGTAEALERSERALQAKLARHARLRPAKVILADLGDSTEMFESAPNANRTNDLQMTEQIRVWRRTFWRWIEAFARVTEDLEVLSVPSNHCRVRAGKNALGPALDDWGIEVLSQVHDIARANDTGAYDHVTFTQPNEHEEFILLEEQGVKLGFTHGHQRGRPEQLVEFAKSTGRRGVGQADIVNVGHFHHLRIIAFGDGQYLIVAPTNDAGSSWFQSSGEYSKAGVLDYVVDENGWRDLDVTWTAP